jgi:hypothetical protein
MTASQIIDEIEKLSPEEREKVLTYVRNRTFEPGKTGLIHIRKPDPEQIRRMREASYTKDNAEIFGKTPPPEDSVHS